MERISNRFGKQLVLLKSNKLIFKEIVWFNMGEEPHPNRKGSARLKNKKIGFSEFDRSLVCGF